VLRFSQTHTTLATTSRHKQWRTGANSNITMCRAISGLQEGWSPIWLLLQMVFSPISGTNPVLTSNPFRCAHLTDERRLLCASLSATRRQFLQRRHVDPNFARILNPDPFDRDFFPSMACRIKNTDSQQSIPLVAERSSLR